MPGGWFDGGKGPVGMSGGLGVELEEFDPYE